MSWNGSDKQDCGEHVARPSTRHGASRMVVLSIIVIALSVCAVYFLTRTAQPPEKESQNNHPQFIKEVAPYVSPTSTVKKAEAEAVADPHKGMRLSSTGVWQPANRPYLPGRRKVHTVISNSMGSASAVHKNGTEQILLRVFSTELGDAPRPIPRLPPDEKQHLIDILISKNEISEKDSESVAMSKEILQEAKKRMMEFIKDGGRPDDFIEHCHMELIDAYKKRLQAEEVLHEAIDGHDDPEFAVEYCKKINAELAKDGIKPLKLTPREKGEVK